MNDFNAVCADLRKKGAEFLGEPFSPTEGIHLVFLRDPDGAVIEIASRDPNIIKESMEQGTVNW